MKKFILRIAHSRVLRIIALTLALVAGIDDLLEAYLGVTDLFGMDVAHGVVITAFTGILDPLAKLFEDSERVDRYEGRGDA